MIQQKFTPSDPARRLGSSPQVVNQIVQIKHATKIDTIADAVAALGKRLQIAVV
jgi:antitoxin HicB